MALGFQKLNNFENSRNKRGCGENLEEIYQIHKSVDSFPFGRSFSIMWGSARQLPAASPAAPTEPRLLLTASQVTWQFLFISDFSEWGTALDEDRETISHLNVTKYLREQWWASFASEGLETLPQSTALPGILAAGGHGEQRLAALEKPHKKKKRKTTLSNTHHWAQQVKAGSNCSMIWKTKIGMRTLFLSGSLTADPSRDLALQPLDPWGCKR